ncbi:MAG: SUMF1/EgtB/PvdO family nonheme iron enzyme [Acidobacteria bacterium]|nr:SUMF1/EgtB/PvdO family nonheme iron enzyme [Acidobacteriota bacterium]
MARENGLVDSMVPVPANLLVVDRSSAREALYHGAYEDDVEEFVTAEEQAMLSEREVVERMFAQDKSYSAAKRPLDLFDFFGDELMGNEARSDSDLTQKTETPAATPAIYDLHSQGEAVPVQPLSANAEYSVAEMAAATLPKTNGFSKVNSDTSNIAPGLLSADATPSENRDTETVPEAEAKITGSGAAVVTSAEKSAAAPVQAVKFIQRPRSTVGAAADKGLIKIIIFLIGLILVFSALIVSGFRLRDLFGRPQPQSTPVAAVSPSLSPPAEKNVPAPEGMEYVPGGKFQMGAQDGDLFEAPAHEVTVAPFFMDRTEVTNEQYAAFIKATNHAAPPDWKNNTFPEGAAKFPVVQVSWQDANDYAAWAGKRLPIEAEWEFAARANDGRRYPWGAEWDVNHANTIESQLNHPVAVGSYANVAHPFGLLDLAGNVWEWMAGDVVSYKDPNITLAPGKVIRGGAFYAPKERATTTFRGFAPPDKKAAGIGFRCVKNVS